MVSLERVIARVVELRAEWAMESLNNPAMEKPEFAYGVAVGRHAGFSSVLAAIEEMIEREEELDAEQS